MIKRTTVRLPSELLKKAQRKAAAEGRTLTGLMEEGLRYVVSEKPADAMKRPPIPIVKEGGGQILSFKELQDLEDREYIERLNRGFE